MAPTPRRTTGRALAGLGLVVVVTCAVVSGCAGGSDGADDAGPTATTRVPTASTAVDTTTAPSPATTAPSGTDAPDAPDGPDAVPSPSTLPPSVEGPCRALAETYGLDAIAPIDSSSWVDERQRVVVDARREQDLLTAAQDGAPSEIVGPLQTLARDAGWLADAVQGSGSYGEAQAAIAAYPDRAAVGTADASVTAWRQQNCPA